VALPQPRAQARAQAIRGSGKRVAEDKRGAGRKPRTTLPWQERALAYYDMIGELHFASQFYARPLSRLKLGVAYRNPEDGSLEPIESGPAVDLLERVQDPGGGRTVMLSTYGQLMFITGESYMLNTVDEEGVEKWEIVSTDELKFDATAGTYTRRASGSGMGEELKAAADDEFEPVDKEAIVYRLWKRHPRYSGWADSPMRAILDIAEELVMLTLAVRARARSRLAQSGILYVPNELSPQPIGAIGDEDPAADPFIDDLTTHFVTPIEDEGTAAAVVPFVVRGPAKIGDVNAKDAFFHLSTHDLEETYPEAALRKEAVERIALGLDMPPEALLGMTDANHWTAWQVADEIWQSHLAPIAQQFCDDLTSVFIRPAAKAEGVERAEEIVVTYDAAEILTNPDRGKDAEMLYKQRAIGKAALRDAVGFEEEDAPTDEELAEMLAVALRDASLIGGDTAAEVVPVDEDPRPPAEEEQPSRNGAGPEGEASARVLGAAEMALVRCRELAGSRLRSKHRARAEMKVCDGRPNTEVAALLGPITLEQLGADPMDLVSEGSSAFQGLLLSWGYAAPEAQALGQMLEMYAARTLFEERLPAAPAGFAGFLHRSKTPA
jgi:hypothetical protein